MRFSVCIATYNRRNTLARTLPTVIGQNFPPDQFEVVIVDDGSTDGTADFLKRLQTNCSVRVLRQSNRGQAIAQNTALNTAQGELVLLLDDDILCEPNLLREHDAAHRASREQCFVFGPILVAEESRPTLATDFVKEDIERYFERLRRYGPQWPEDAQADANCSAPTCAFRTAGGMDEHLVVACNSSRTNKDLGLRLWKAGLRFHFQPTAVTRQIHLKTSRELIHKDAWFYGRNEVLLARKHPEYRIHSAIVSLGKGTFAKRLARRVASMAPVSLDCALRPPFAMAEFLRSVPGIRRAGVRLLQARLSIATFGGMFESHGPWEALLNEFGRRLPVLIYHHVGPARPRTYPELTVSPADFRRQMNWLDDHGYTGISPSEWLFWCREGKPLPPRPVLLTFDDAYADLVEHAFPVLRQHGFKAGVYVVTSHVGGTNVWDQIIGSGAHRLMNSQQLRVWAGCGIEFGAHSRTHADLTQLSAHALEEEVAGSKLDLEEILNRQVLSFAYPFGYQNEPVRACVAKHFELAFGVNEGINSLATDLYSLQRTMVCSDDSISRFASRVLFGWPPIARLRSRLRIRSRVVSAWRELLT